MQKKILKELDSLFLTWNDFFLIESLITYILSLNLFMSHLDFMCKNSFFFFIDFVFNLGFFLSSFSFNISVFICEFYLLIFFFFFITTLINYFNDFGVFYLMILFNLKYLIFLCLSSSNILFFYFFFESLLFLMVILVLLTGKRLRKIKAVYLLVIYTVIGSIFFFFSLLSLWFELSSVEFYIIKTINITFKNTICVFLMFFVFAIKVPIAPFHSWLPEVHVEANTTGSIILAAILLKIGMFGLIRINFVSGFNFYNSFCIVLCMIGFIYLSFVLFRQLDLKRFIAYCSIIHMSLAVIGLIVFNIVSLSGSILTCFTHALIAGILFYCIGIIYDNFHTKIYLYINSLVTVAPVFSSMLLIFLLSNVNFPLTAGFLAELLISIGIFNENIFLAIFIVFSSIVLFSSSMLITNKILFGSLRDELKLFSFNYLQFFVLCIFIFLIILFGIDIKSILWFWNDF